MTDRTVYFVSDGTGITAETFGNSILAQFEIKPRHVRRPFIDTAEKAYEVCREINESCVREGKRPVAFITLVNDEAMPEYTVFNLMAGYRLPSSGFFKNPEIRLNVSNLFNKEYLRINSPSGSAPFSSAGTSTPCTSSPTAMLRSSSNTRIRP